MEKGKAVFLISSITFFAVFGIFIGLYVYEVQNNPLFGGGSGGIGGYNITITIDYSNGTSQNYYNINGTNVLNLTQTIAVVDPDPNYGYDFIYRINHYPNDPPGENLWWVYTLNGISAGPVKLVYPSNNSVIYWHVISY
ncbi:MAG: hypothetical protein ACTSVY_10600 [Candidatus Helarchaeota archaeon]